MIAKTDTKTASPEALNESIADVFGAPLGTIKSQLSRGRDLLRREIEALAAPAELLTSTVTELDRWVGSLAEALHGAAREG